MWDGFVRDKQVLGQGGGQGPASPTHWQGDSDRPPRPPPTTPTAPLLRQGPVGDGDGPEAGAGGAAGAGGRASGTSTSTPTRTPRGCAASSARTLPRGWSTWWTGRPASPASRLPAPLPGLLFSPCGVGLTTMSTEPLCFLLQSRTALQEEIFYSIVEDQ